MMTIVIRINPICFELVRAIFMMSALLLLLLLQVYVVGAEKVGCVEKERQALLHFKAGLVDESGMLASWGTEEDKRDCCQWKGVRCSNRTGHIQRLELPGGFLPLQILRGNIPKSLMELQHLRYLDLSYNDFSDTLNLQFLGSLSNLRYLDLSHSGFGGKIPSQFGSLSHLKYLDFSGNSLEGSIPCQLGNLSKLQYLDLRVNSLEGTIPSQLGNLSNLKELYLAYNYDLALKIDARGQWLSNLTSLTHLDLSHLLNLNSSHNWLQLIGKLSKLRKLTLSECSLSDHFLLSLSPSKFKFPTSLVFLDLSLNTFTSPMIFHWVSNVSTNLVELYLGGNLLEGLASNHFGTSMNSLERLDLNDNRLKGEDLKSFTNISTLRSLSLSRNNLTEELPSIFHNLFAGYIRYSLQELDLSFNQINGSLPDLSTFSSLKILDLSYNWLSGKIPKDSRLPSQLKSLSIRSNSLEGGIPKSFGTTCTLTSLDMYNNSLSEELAVIVHHLSACARYSLQELVLNMNQITGTLPDLSIFPSLRRLLLSENKLIGKIPKFPSHLEELQISSNSLRGVITDSHFANMSKLKVLNLSDNSLVMTFGHNWVPSFHSFYIGLRSCLLGPSFPKWLQTQINLNMLDISNASISDTVPEWFWVLSTKLGFVNISYNNLTGTIPDVPLKLTEYPSIFLSTNQFEGSIPPFLRRAMYLDLSKNQFSDFVLFVCANDTAERLGGLDLSNNHLAGQIPNCWSSFKSLAYLDLSNNNLSGQVPTSMGSALRLQALILRNNNLTGEPLSSLRSCTTLVMLDLGENRFSGLIPSWIGNNLVQLQMISLRRNNFYGNLPLSLCYLTSIHLLDLSSNNLTGQIPKCFKNFSAMTQERFSVNFRDHSYGVNQTLGSTYVLNYDLFALLMWKGADHTIKNDKLLLKGIDLSSNQLSGEIPAELGNLVELVSLNLSRNNLTGNIPWEIGRLVSLDFLDLSRNHLFGSIPSSLAQIDRLSVLDLSHNNLSGKIPIGTQLQSFNASSYEENPDLCGPPLEKICLEEETPQESLVKTQEDEHSLFSQTFYMSMGFGFFSGFWGFFGPVVFSRSWRYTYFRFLNNLSEKMMSK